MAYRLDHFYISPAQCSGEISQQLMSQAVDSKIMLINQTNICDPADFCISPASRPCLDFTGRPFSWSCSFSRGPLPLASGRLMPAPVHCRSLWEADNAWNGSYLQLERQTSFPAPLPAACYENHYPDAGLGLQEDCFSYLEERNVPLLGRQLAVRVFKEAGELKIHQVRRIEVNI